MISRKLRGGALQLSLFIGVIVTLLLLSMILLIHINGQFKTVNTTLVTAMECGEQILTSPEIDQMNFGDSIALRDEVSKKIVGIKKEAWGLFDLVTTSVEANKISFRRTAFVGSHCPPNDRPTLYLENTQRPLVVVGNTFIEGKVFLPDSQVRTGSIKGHSYYGSQLIYGSIYPSYELPTLKTEQLDYILDLPNHYLNSDQSNYFDMERGIVKQQSFQEFPFFYYSPEKLVLDEVDLIGHVIIQSAKEIFVSSTSRLNDVLLIAPSIAIEKDFKGRIQAFSTESIKIGEGVYLEYPSALTVSLKEKIQDSIQTVVPNIEEPSIIIEKNSSLKGMVLFLDEANANTYRTQVLLEEGSEVTGELYVSGNLELRGKVKGSVYTKSFVAMQNGSAYQNHLYNTVISSLDLPENFVGIPFKNKPQSIAKWMY